MKDVTLGTKYLLGIDEAGRGPIAGPLSLGFILFERERYLDYLRWKDGLPLGKDSKKLNPRQREIYYQSIEDLARAGRLSFANVLVGNKVIDEKGLSYALSYAIRTGIKKLGVLGDCSVEILLDGGLKAPQYFKQKTIIRGDESEKIIGLASIVAKVRRDRLMERIDKKIPWYGFAKHKGYGTKEHYKNIEKHGLSHIHRKTFLRSILTPDSHSNTL